MKRATQSRQQSANRDRKNIFAIARRGSTGDEDQLTELLAYLIQEQPAIASKLLADFGYKHVPSSTLKTQRCVVGGRLDLEFEVPECASVVVESKLGATIGARQCKKYIEHLASKPQKVRSLVKLTKLHEPWPEGIEEFAAKHNVELVARRWWDVTSLLRGASIGGPLANDFAEMLVDEGIVVPGRLTEDDWADSSEIPPAAIALVAELKGMLAQLSTGFRRQAIFRGRDLGFRSLYCLAYFERAQVGAGLAATWKDLVLHRRLKSIRDAIEGPVIACSVMNPSLGSEAEHRVAAEQAVSRGGNDVVGSCWGKFPTRAASATSVLTAPGFLGQVEQAVEYARATVKHFREVEYLADTS